MPQEFGIGVVYNAMLNGVKRQFEVIGDGRDENEMLIQWDDGDTEYAYLLDMKKWTEDAI